MEKRKRSNILTIERQIIYSKAFQKLSGTSKTVFFLFLDRRQLSKQGRKGKEKTVIVNNGNIVFTYCEAEKKFGIIRSSFRRALDQLIKHGFLDINHHGGGFNKDCTTYFISDRYLLFNKEGFKVKERPKDLRGFGFKKK